MIGPCTASATPVRPFRVNLGYPAGPKPGSVTVLVGYKSTLVTLPTPPNPQFTQFPSNTTRGITNLGYAARVVASRALGFDAGKLLLVNFYSCSGQPAPTVEQFGCTVEGCANATGPIDGCTCTVATP